jgi:hypothetical protein
LKSPKIPNPHSNNLSLLERGLSANFLLYKGALSLKRLRTPDLNNEVLSEQPKKGRGRPRKVANALADSPKSPAKNGTQN